MIAVRGLRLEDLPELAALDRDIFGRLAYPHFVLRQFFDVYRQGFLVLDGGGGILGYSLAVKSDVDQGETAHYLALGVRKEDRGKGLGRYLAQATLDGLAACGVRRVSLAVEPRNTPALSLYLSLGFEKVTWDEEYYGVNEPRIVLHLALPGVGVSSQRFSELAAE